MCLTGGSEIFNENETYPRALLHWTRAAAQGLSFCFNPYSQSVCFDNINVYISCYVCMLYDLDESQ